MTDFRFEVGKRYARQDGVVVTIVAERTIPNYECVQGDDISPTTGEGVWRNNRKGDVGRVTGSPFDFRDPRNLVPEEVVEEENPDDLIPLVEEDFAYTVVAKRWGEDNVRAEVRRWCINQFGGNRRIGYKDGEVLISKGTRWFYNGVSGGEFSFRHQNDAFEFKMRWG